jgi:glycosyltransferase involved in cell wall biosynthesis
MKIVHVCLTGGYTEGFSYQENYLTKYQALAGNDVTVITTQYCWNKNIWGKCKKTGYYNDYGVYVVRIPYKWKLPYKVNTYIGMFVGLYDELVKVMPDIIFIHNLQFKDIRIIRRYKEENPNVRVFADNHSDFSNSARNWLAYNVLYRFHWKRCAKSIEDSVEKFYGVLPARVDFLKNVYGIAADKVELLVMGADDESVTRVADKNVRNKIREKFCIKKDDFLIVTGGKIDSFKLQTLMLMEAVKKMDNPNVKLLVFGSVEENIMPRLNKLCDGKKIQYIGWVEGNQSYDYFSAADLVIFPGRHSVYWEQVVGMGIPMVCKYWEGTTHIDIGGNVEFMTEDSVEGIKNIIESIVNDPPKYAHMKQMACTEAMKMFSYEEISKKAIGLEL